MNRYMFRFPGSFYPVIFEATSEEKARKKAREFLGTSAIPHGTDIWKAPKHLTYTGVDAIGGMKE